jgi:hypothetical protein
MEIVFIVLAEICVLAVPILFVIFLIKWIRRRPKKKIGLAALACMVGIIVFTVVGSQMQLANMTPEEREAYYAEQQLKIEQREQKRQERAEAAQLEKDRRAAEEAERQAAEELRIEQAAAEKREAEQERIKAAEEAENAARIEAERLEQERLSVTFDEIYWAYKENELRANDTYKNNRYRITAKINGMATGGLFNWTGGATLTMEKRVGNTIVFFYAEFEKEQEEALKKVNVGDTITFEGECLSAGSWVDCEIVE